jgi:hypothetical protein
MQLLSKRDQVQVGEFLAVTAKLAVEVLALGNELRDQMLHIHTFLHSLGGDRT